MLKNVAVYIQEGAGAFGLGVACEVFGYDRSAEGLPAYDFAICALQAGPVRTDAALVVQAEHGIERLDQADLILIPSWENFDVWPPEPLLAAVRAATARGATVVSHCSGAFVLAAAGLLDGKRATTHWQHAAALAARFPKVCIDPGVLYVDEGRILTSAGTAAGIDLCLYLVRREHGARVANAIARRMVVPAHRDGGQAQYVEAPMPDIDDTSHLIAILDWARAHLDDDLTVESLAARALTSPRSFARHFRTATGTTPHAWVLSQRMSRAEELLEDGNLPVEEVARRSGFGTTAAMRLQFARRRGVPPRSYRRNFRRNELPA
ncbi:MAG: helix-turn-helix domain-containing protein [Mycobacteriales bacterium]